MRERNDSPRLGAELKDVGDLRRLDGVGRDRLERVVGELGREVQRFKHSGIGRAERREPVHQESTLVEWQPRRFVVAEPLGKARGDRSMFARIRVE